MQKIPFLKTVERDGGLRSQLRQAFDIVLSKWTIVVLVDAFERANNVVLRITQWNANQIPRTVTVFEIDLLIEARIFVGIIDADGFSRSQRFAHNAFASRKP